MLRSLRMMLSCDFRVEFDDGFGKIEIDGAVFVAARVKEQSEFFHVAEMLSERCVLSGDFGIAFEHFVDVCVSHALGGPDDSGREMRGAGIYRLRRIP